MAPHRAMAVKQQHQYLFLAIAALALTGLFGKMWAWHTHTLGQQSRQSRIEIEQLRSLSTRFAQLESSIQSEKPATALLTERILQLGKNVTREIARQGIADRTALLEHVAQGTGADPARELKPHTCSDPPFKMPELKTEVARASEKFGGFAMHVYSSIRTGGVRRKQDQWSQDDIVSREIRSRGSWEGQETQAALDLLGPSGTLLDVGANIGWFTLSALAAGHSVVAFEAFRDNFAMLSGSVCLQDPGFGERARLFPFGLDTQSRVCDLVQMQSVNVGDANTVCEGDAKKYMRERGHKKFGEVRTTTLDEALRVGAFKGITSIEVMKMDIEGFEPRVFMGGNEFFHSFLAPKVITIEFKQLQTGQVTGGPEHAQPYLMGELVFLREHGYGQLHADGRITPLRHLDLHDVCLELDKQVDNALFAKVDRFDRELIIN